MAMKTAIPLMPQGPCQQKNVATQTNQPAHQETQTHLPANSPGPLHHSIGRELDWPLAAGTKVER